MRTSPLGKAAGWMVLAGALAWSPVAARGGEAQAVPRSRVTLGGEVDLLPLLLSASAGKLGGGMNLWAGVDQVRLRLVGSSIAFPPGSLTPRGFDDRRLAAAAGIVDLFFAPDFSGPWIGTGVEHWWNTVGSATGPGTAACSGWVYTLGAGYVWKLWGNLYLNPWAAGHLLLSRQQVTLNGATWTPTQLTGEVSLKIGWFFRA